MKKETTEVCSICNKSLDKDAVLGINIKTHTVAHLLCVTKGAPKTKKKALLGQLVGPTVKWGYR